MGVRRTRLGTAEGRARDVPWPGTPAHAARRLATMVSSAAPPGNAGEAGTPAAEAVAGGNDSCAFIAWEATGSGRKEERNEP